MSAAVGSAKQANALSEDAEALYDPYWGFALNNLCSDVPWPEWTDAELNSEAWDAGKGTRTNTGAGGKVPLPTTVSAFEDPKQPTLPPPASDYVRAWERAQNVFVGAALTVYDPSNVDFELQLPSTASSACQFLRVFIEHMTLLQYHAVKYGFQVELESPNFVSTTQGEIWRPWHHVYALCKAGKGQAHKPQYCPYGKYVLRLFYMGTWRRFIVDDRIPCDADGNCMLPVTQVPGELWPILLAKGILKILSLTPTQDFTLTDFPLVSAFTGWTHGHFVTENKSSDQVWRRLVILSPHYEQPDEVQAVTVAPKNQKIESSKKDSRKKESRKSPEREEAHHGERFCVLFANLIGSSSEEDLALDCTVSVTMTRDNPLVKANKREGTKPWKRIRWIYWAKKKGLWIDENQLPPYRRLLIVSYLPELSGLLSPDPKLEAALYDIPIEDSLVADEQTLVEEGKVFEPEQWCDYFRFLEYVVGVNVFFKPSYFISNFKVSCLREKLVESPRAVPKGTSKQPPPQNTLVFPTGLRQTFNEPILLICEALTGIFLSISLWVCPQKEKECYGYLDPDQPKLLKVGHASLVVEQCDWRFISEGQILGFVKTVGYSSVVLNLKPGRHILKLWLCSDSSYIVDINSNVGFVVGKSPKIRYLMNTESQQILQYIHNVSNSFIALTQKFGKPDLPAALRDFYEVIKPKNDSVRDYYRKLDDFIENFLNCILLTLKDLIPQAEEVMIMMWTLRALFLDPNIRCELSLAGPVPSFYGASSKKVTRKPIPVPVERSLSEIIGCISEEDENKVIKIQKVFRGFRVRLLWKCQTPGSKEFKPFTERLKKICEAVFALPKREMEVGKLLRRIVTIKPDLLTSLKFHGDFSNVVQVEEFTGKIPNAEPFAWIPIARFVIACHCEDTVPGAFYLSCNLEQTVVQGFDNDSGVEIFRLANTVSPYYYSRNVRGYTILVFGWNEASVKTVNWRLEMVKMKHFQSIHLCNLLGSATCLPYAMPSLDTLEIRNFYIPNSKSKIFRCVIKVHKRTLLTLRVYLSYSRVEFAVVLWLKDGNLMEPSESNAEKIIAEVTSTNGAVMLPSLLLEHVEGAWAGESYPDPDYTLYVLEAYVLYNSWPLTKQEWGLVEPIRVNGESWRDSSASLLQKRGGSESRKKLNRSRRSMTEQKIENPFWLLQALNDAAGQDSGDATIIEEDKSYAEEVKAWKLSCEEKDPGRRKRGREMRKNFLYQLYLEERKNYMYGEDCREEGDSVKSEDTVTDPQIIVDRLSSFTYLINDTSPTRYINSPRILPWTPLRELLYKYRQIDGISSTRPETESRDTQSSDLTGLSYKDVDNLMGEMEDERLDFLRQCLHYRSVLTTWLNDEQKLSNLLMDQAYETRTNLLERMWR